MGNLYKRLKQYGDEDYYPYHMPGHKRRLCGEMPTDVLKIDITEIDGFDNLHQAEGILQKLQEKAALLYGAEESFYLVNGSTCGILSAVSAALPRGGHLLMSRNCHKSAYHVAYLRNLTVSYLYPEVNQEYDICDVVTPEQIRMALEEEPDIEAVLIVSPTYEGRIADIEGIAQVIHAKGIPLIVDEAHGAHLGLGQKEWKCFPNSCQSGADLVIHSVHKTLPAMTQTALLHVNGKIIDRDKLRRFLHIYQSSSPSYVLMASIDNALQLVEEQGEELFADFWNNYREMTEQLRKCRCLQFLPTDGRQDMGKLVISSKKAGFSGQQIYDILLQKYHLQLEMAAGSYCLAMFTIGDTKDGFQRMTDALLSIDKDIAEKKILSKSSFFDDTYNEKISWKDPLKVIPLAEAWDMPYEEVTLQTAIGRHVAEFVNLYPPGIPLLVPGEVLQENQYRQILQYLEQKLTVQGVSDTAPYLIKVLR